MPTPATPTNLSLDAYTTGAEIRVALQWTAQLQSGDFAKIEYATGVDSSGPTSSYTQYDTAPTYVYNQGGGINIYIAGVVTSLTDETWYYFRVRNENSGVYSSYTNVAFVRTPSLSPGGGLPATPTNVSTANTLSGIVISWTDAASDETYYVVSRERQTIYAAPYDWSLETNFNLAAGSTTYTDTSAINSTTYRYTVAACNDNGCSWSSGSVITRNGGAVGAPYSLTATPVSSSQINLAWSYAGSADYFSIERSSYNPQTGIFTGYVTLVSVVLSSPYTYSNTGLSAGSTYYYRVRASVANQFSAYSNEAQATTTGSGATLTAPSNLAGVAETGPQVKLTWNDNSGATETGFQIERMGGLDPQFVLLFTTGANVVTYTDTNVVSGSSYTYRVRAVNSGTGAFSNYTSNVTVGIDGGVLTGTGYGIAHDNPSFTVTIPSINGVIRDNQMSNNGKGNIANNVYTSPGITIDNPSTENRYIRRGITIIS